jgi:hypothetical protein
VARVIVGIFLDTVSKCQHVEGILPYLRHERDDITDGFEKSSQTFVPLLTRASPQRSQNSIERLDTERMRSFGQRSDCQSSNSPHFGLLVVEAVGDTINELLQVRENSASHEDRNLLDDLDTCVPSLPRLPALADSVEERHKGRDGKSGSDDGEGSGSRVPDVLVRVIDIRTHCANHMGEAGSLTKI